MVRIVAVSPINVINIASGTQVDFAVVTDEPCNIKIVAVNESDLEIQVVNADYSVNELQGSVIFADEGKVNIVVTAEKDNVVFDSYHWNVYVLSQETIDQMPEGMPVYDTKKSGFSTGLLVLGAVAIAAFS